MRCHKGAWVPLVAALCLLEVQGQFQVEQQCGVDDYRCPANGKCIDSSKYCDQVVDCPDGNDEKHCDCRADEFKCLSDGRCIQSRQRCDNINHCPDGSDEDNCDWSGHHVCKESGRFRCSDGTCISMLLRCDGFKDCRGDGLDEKGCPCSSDQWQCDKGNCIRRSKRCNGRVDCPSDRSDERNCIANGYFKCSSGKNIPQSLRCNRNYDCPKGDYSDEQNCPCGDQDFKCNNGYCISKNKRCDLTHDCQDGSDEFGCNYGKVCMAYEFKCTSGQCIHPESRCNGTKECYDGSDENNCPCKRGQFQCRDGSCKNIALRCNGRRDCVHGEDEFNCDSQRCPADKFTCDVGSVVRCATACDGNAECDGGEDEFDCTNGCLHPCDGGCLDESKVCDGNIDCSDQSDEEDCDNCDGPDDFRCLNGDCTKAIYKCNGDYECYDKSDELNCNVTQISSNEGCTDTQFRCKDGTCINKEFKCDQRYDCNDQSDEDDCPWFMTRASRSPSLATCLSTQFTCYEGSCIPLERRCDNIYDCSDFSDEQNCYAANRAPDYPYPASTLSPVYTTTPRTYNAYSPRSDPYGSDRRTPDRYSPYAPGNSGSDDSTNAAATDEYSEVTTETPARYDPYGRDQDRQPGNSDYGNRASDNYGDPYGRTTPYPSTATPGYGRDPYGNGGYGQGTPSNDPYYNNPYGNDYNPSGSGTSGQNPNENGARNDPYGRDQSRQPGSSDYGNRASDNYGDPYGSTTSNPSTASPGYGREPYGNGNNPSGRGTSGQDQSGYPSENGDPYGNGYNSGGRGTSGQDQSGYPSENGDPYGNGYNSGGRGTSGQDQSGYPSENGDPYGNGYNSGGRGTSGQDQSGYPSENGDTYGNGYNSGGRGTSGQDQSGYPSENGDPYGNGYNSGGSGTSTGQDQSGYPSENGGGRPSENAGSARGGSVACQRHEWRCENGPCIDARRRCDGIIDCPYDSSDEFDCARGSPKSLLLMTYPKNQTVRYGGDVVFQCRDEGLIRAPVRWVREGGRSLKPGFTEKNGRLELFQVTKGDAGVYICQAPAYLGTSGSEKRVTLYVENQKIIDSRPAQKYCKINEATCRNGDCILKSSVCDGKVDCSDRSDEDMCPETGKCEPNQFQCDNHRCVLKTWLCDSEDDCGDGSDERKQYCDPARPGQACLASEFTCADSQCIPKSFHCDGRSDCMDKSDEIGCAPVYIVKPPTPANLHLNTGDTLVLRAEAKGNPVPFISWRLNWGHVPPQCTSTSENGIGVLTCPNMQPEHSGAYSAEALNNQGTTFANPDSIVFVSQISPCPPGYFNNEARSQQECIRCFCFGESNQCKSADLFTYNMPTPLGQGGTRLQGVAVDEDGEIRSDPSINNHYYYQALRNGATITKLARYDQSSLGSFHPYLTLPESYQGPQLTSYGGRIKFTLAPHSRAYTEDRAPRIIVKGKYATLFHFSRDQNPSTTIGVDVRLTPENWVKSSRSGFEPASREDIMMALDFIDTILLRADSNGAGVNISNFEMESAHDINSGLGAASLVEECTCPPGYEGLSCQKCAAGYVREKSGPWLGNCVREACPPGTFGDPSSGLPCKPCPCPLTNRENQFARTCSLTPDGSVACNCFPGYEGKSCEKCAPGYEGNPFVQGDTCRVEAIDRCNAVGTLSTRLLDECVCKDNVQGRYCDQCKNSSFYLSNDFRHGCALCFCSGMSTQCMSSNLRRKTTFLNFNVPSIVDQVKVYSSAPAGIGGVRYGAPAETELKPTLASTGLTLRGYDRSRPTVYYWSMPLSFTGDKVTSYGGFLRYTLENVPRFTNVHSPNNHGAADVQLISDNHLTFQYTSDILRPTPDGVLNASIQFLETTGWHRSDGKEVAREHFLLALADVKAILIKASYGNTIATPIFASIETAEPDGSGAAALHVEQCVCPPGYIGTSCEDCGNGYTRSPYFGIYLNRCNPCECNGRSSQCHPETGVCYGCTGNTEGEHCEECKPGYQRDEYNNCIEIEGSNLPCSCDPRGSAGPCDQNGQCRCKANVEGQYCDRCRPGTFGLEERNPDGCIQCYCSGATRECQEANHFTRIPLAAPIIGDDHGGYSLTDLNAQSVINEHFVPVPDRSELIYSFTFPPSEELYWSLPVFPGNRVTSYGGTLSLRQEFQSNTYNDDLSQPGTDVVLFGDGLTVFWTNPNTMRSGQSLSYQVPLVEQGWYILGSTTPASRTDFMRVLKSLRRVLVRATVAPNIASTTIADVSMDTATETFQDGAPVALGVELCSCPPGHLGTSCESCAAGYYKDEQEYCTQCPCAGHDCQLDAFGRVTCNCRPPHTGPDCSAIGLVMELHPEIREAIDGPFTRRVILTCKYRAPEPLAMKFVVAGVDQTPWKFANESVLLNDGWHGEHVLSTVWDMRQEGHVYECHTLTARGSTLGVLTTDMRTAGVNPPAEVGEPQVTSLRPQTSQPTVTVRIISPTIKIQEVGTSVNFTCEAQSKINSNRLRKTWTKDDGYLPLGRVFVDEYTGVLTITNLQATDSGVYVCQANDGVSTVQASVTLRVPANRMTVPTAYIKPAVSENYEGDRIEIECIVSGDPAPSISWQRASRTPLPRSSQQYDSFFVIENAKEEDSGEYSCIASNTVGSNVTTAVINVRPLRPRERLIVTPTAPTVDEGQSTKVVCTGPRSVSPGSIDWVRQDNGYFQSNVRSDNGVLYIDRATVDNQGVYLCQSRDADIEPVAILLTVSVITQGESSDIIVQDTQIKIPSGQHGTVACIPSGKELPQIKWSRYQGEFGTGTSQRGNMLIVNNAQESDQGYYVCEGLINGQQIKNIYVYVEIEKREAPKVQILPEGEHSVTIGSTFQFACRVLEGIPEPTVTWSRSGGRELSSTTEIKPNNILRFDKVDVNDEGEYICTGSNIVGDSSDSAVVKVRSPPEINLTPNFLVVNIGEPINVECRAQGHPDPYVSIRGPNSRRDGEVPTIRMSSVRIAAATEADDGEYMCTATNEAGTVNEPFIIRVERGDGGVDDGNSGEIDIYNSSPNPPIYQPYDPNYRPPSDMIIVEGQPKSEIDCVVNRGEARWDREDRRPLQSNVKQIGNKLVIYNVSSINSGVYRCSLFDTETGSVSVARTVYLRIVRMPKITLRPQKQLANPGDSPIVECVVEGDNIIDVHWDPYDQGSGGHIEIKNTILKFNQIRLEDAGEYKCYARSQHGTAIGTAEVAVTDIMEMETSESHANEQRVRTGAAVVLSCNVTAPGARVSWYKDQRPLPPSVRLNQDGSLYIKLVETHHSGRYDCNFKDAHGRVSSNYINLHIEDPRNGAAQLVQIDQPRRRYLTGENVEVDCRAPADAKIKWEKYGTNQIVEYRSYGGGAMLIVHGVASTDAGVYRCTAVDSYGRSSYEDFVLEVEPGSSNPTYPRERNTPIAKYTARLRDSIEMPCNHDLDEPVNIQWRRLYAQLPSEARSDQPILHLTNVNEGDAGTYICRVSNSRATVEARAILRVAGVVPSFNGESWIALPTIKDAYRKFDIEVSFKPSDESGMILYNSQNPGPNGDYLALQLIKGVPIFIIETGDGPVYVKGDRPLQMKTWHTIRLSRISSRVTMTVDNSGPFINETAENWVLDLQEPLYVAGVPEVDNLPPTLAGADGFIGCVSMLILGREEVNIMQTSLDQYNVEECNSCAPNLCLNDGVCQEARNELGYICFCANGFAGQNCDRQGEACHPGLCGQGKCHDTADGYKCACPVTHTGKNCNEPRTIDFPAFAGNAYLALQPPNSARYFKMAMKIKPTAPVQDGIIMYCAESNRGYGGFTSLAVRNKKLEFRYDLNEGNPVVLVANSTLQPDQWTDVQITRSGPVVSLNIDLIHKQEKNLGSAKSLKLEAMYVGGVDESVILNNNTGVTGGFYGCIKDVSTQGKYVNIVNTSLLIESADVQECSVDIRGDIQSNEFENTCSCENGGICTSSGTCICPSGFIGQLCESRVPYNSRRPAVDPCATLPCRNGGTCRVDYSNHMMNHTCDCPLGYAGVNCQMELHLYNSVGFNGNGYLELPATLINYEVNEPEPAVIALAVRTAHNGVLLYQTEMVSNGDYSSGDYVLLRIDQGYVIVEWNMGSGVTSLTVSNREGFVADGNRHQIIVRFLPDNNVELTVDTNTVTGQTVGFASRMNADSNIYIGGIPDRMNIQQYPGLMGCIEQVEFGNERALDLGRVAVAARNTQRCRDNRP